MATKTELAFLCQYILTEKEEISYFAVDDNKIKKNTILARIDMKTFLIN